MRPTERTGVYGILLETSMNSFTLWKFYDFIERINDHFIGKSIHSIKKQFKTFRRQFLIYMDKLIHFKSENLLDKLKNPSTIFQF